MKRFRENEEDNFYEKDGFLVLDGSEESDEQDGFLEESDGELNEYEQDGFLVSDGSEEDLVEGSTKRRRHEERFINGIKFIPMIKELLDAGGVNARDEYEKTPLHLAAQHQPDAIPLLLEYGANVNARNKNGNTPLHIAAGYQPDAIPILLQAGADVNARAVDGWTPLHVAAQFRGYAIPILLEYGANVNARDENGWTPLHLATQHQSEAIPILLQYGADVNAQGEDGWTPLHYAAAHQPEAIPILLQAGADVNAQEEDGWTPLHIAAQYQPDAIPILLEAGANVNAQDRNGWTPLHIAAEYHPDVIPKLLEAGADLTARTNDKRTAFDLCRNDKCRSYLKKKHFQQIMSRERESSQGSQIKSLPPLPELPLEVWEYIMHKKLHKELCEHLQNENNRSALFRFARQMKVPEAMLQEWNQLSKSEICEKLAKLLSVGAFYSEKGMDFLIRRERAQRGLGVWQQFLDTLNELGISAEGKSIAELLEELKRVEINPSL